MALQERGAAIKDNLQRNEVCDKERGEIFMYILERVSPESKVEVELHIDLYREANVAFGVLGRKNPFLLMKLVTKCHDLKMKTNNGLMIVMLIKIM